MGPKEQEETPFVPSRTQVEMASAQSLQKVWELQDFRAKAREGGMVQGCWFSSKHTSSTTRDLHCTTSQGDRDVVAMAQDDSG